MAGETSHILTDVSDDYDYKVVATHNTYLTVTVQKTYKPFYIDDAKADWNYYQGLNYVNSDTGALPTGVNQGLYDETNLVYVAISYSGSQVFGENIYTGTVSLAEQESEFVYYKYYPVVAGKITIELIDNPFTNRPNGKGFNNWVPDHNYGTISFDSIYYKRYIEINVTYTGGIPDDIAISLSASWVDAAVVAKDASNSWVDVFASLNDKGIKTLPTSIKYTGESMAGYYVADGSGYRLIQSYDSNKTYNSGTTYYYMVTRDTNIVYLTRKYSYYMVIY